MSKLAIVTGGTRGIGRAVSILLQSYNYKVAAVYRSNEKEALSLKEEYGIDIFNCDVQSLSNCHTLINKIMNYFNQDIDVLVNNAGIIIDKLFHKMDYLTWRKVIDGNLNSCFNMCHVVYPIMRDNKKGDIVNISSVNALCGQVGQVNYAAAKAAIIGFSKALALEAAHRGVRVNVVAPGYVRTDMTNSLPTRIIDKIIDSIPLKRMGTVEEIANAVLFLVNQNSNFITGETLCINGGQYMK